MAARRVIIMQSRRVGLFMSLPLGRPIMFFFFFLNNPAPPKFTPFPPPPPFPFSKPRGWSPPPGAPPDRLVNPRPAPPGGGKKRPGADEMGPGVRGNFSPPLPADEVATLTSLAR